MLRDMVARWNVRTPLSSVGPRRARYGCKASKGNLGRWRARTREHGQDRFFIAAVERPALAYLRTSSSSNVGADKDSDKRQRLAIATFAKHGGYELLEEFYDAAVSGADPIDARPGFKSLLERIMTNGVRTVIVEDASRFARTLMVQEAGIATLAGLGVACNHISGRRSHRER
jgi:Resolvase, N terminal domain